MTDQGILEEQEEKTEQERPAPLPVEDEPVQEDILILGEDKVFPA